MTSKGYGRPHTARRKRLLDLLVPGDPCDECHEGMYPEQDLEADHSEPLATSGGRGEADRLLHASCNARRGARLGNRLRGERRHGIVPELPRPKTSREW